MGVDIEDVGRIRTAVARFGKRFLRRIYTQSEIDYCMKKRDPYPHLTARFAAKEAAVKAFAQLGKTFTKDFEIVATGDIPKLVYHGGVRFSPYEISLSISHTRELATAVVAVYLILSAE